MLLIFSPVLFTSYCRFHCSYFPYFLFFIFHFLQHNQHIIFFEGNFTRVISCLSSKIDHFQGGLLVSLFLILQCLGGRKLLQYCVVCRLKDWAYPGSWIGSVPIPAFIGMISKPGTILSVICSAVTIICYFY